MANPAAQKKRKPVPLYVWVVRHAEVPKLRVKKGAVEYQIGLLKRGDRVVDVAIRVGQNLVPDSVEVPGGFVARWMPSTRLESWLDSRDGAGFSGREFNDLFLVGEGARAGNNTPPFMISALRAEMLIDAPLTKKGTPNSKRSLPISGVFPRWRTKVKLLPPLAKPGRALTSENLFDPDREFLVEGE